MSKSAKAFLTKLDELNVIMLESYYSAKQKKQVIEDLHDLNRTLVKKPGR